MLGVMNGGVWGGGGGVHISVATLHRERNAKTNLLTHEITNFLQLLPSRGGTRL